MAAAQRAIVLGKPLTRHLTVRLERQGISDANAVKAIGRLITLLRDHVRKTNGSEIAYIWSREHGAIIGGHVHILLHLPASYFWQGQRVQRWIERISGRPYNKGVIKTTRIGGTAKAHESNPNLYLANLATVVGYVMKGTCPNAPACFWRVGQMMQQSVSPPLHYPATLNHGIRGQHRCSHILFVRPFS
jgi:hypothetical protein